MTLDELARKLPVPPPPRVPDWALGTHRRRSISFATGIEDASTFVVWVQAHGMTGDLRIHPARPRLTADDRLEDLDLDSLVRLASVEGGIAATAWAAGVMRWSGWIGFQPYDKYPEPGVLRRVGDCMIEFAPSGIYVEDWRYQKSAPGLLAGLRLVAETAGDGTERPSTSPNGARTEHFASRLRRIRAAKVRLSTPAASFRGARKASCSSFSTAIRRSRRDGGASTALRAGASSRSPRPCPPSGWHGSPARPIP